MSMISKQKIILCCGCLCSLTFGIYGLFADASKGSASEDHDHWVTEAQKLIEQLDAMASVAPDVKMPCMKKIPIQSRYKVRIQTANANKFANKRTAEKIIWRLWLLTGKPPQMQQSDATPHDFLSRHAEEYRQYVARHAALSHEAVCRIGLKNAVDSIGSPLWYMTIKYLNKAARLPQDWMIDIRTTPTRIIVEFPLSEKDYDRMSLALENWLESNKKRMVWNSKINCFCPLDGKYTSTDILWKALVMQRSDNKCLQEGKASDTNGT